MKETNINANPPSTPATGSEKTCRVAIAVGKYQVVLPHAMNRSDAEKLSRVLEIAGAVTWYLPPNDAAQARRAPDAEYGTET